MRVISTILVLILVSCVMTQDEEEEKCQLFVTTDQGDCDGLQSCAVPDQLGNTNKFENLEDLQNVLHRSRCFRRHCGDTEIFLNENYFHNFVHLMSSIMVSEPASMVQDAIISVSGSDTLTWVMTDCSSQEMKSGT